MIINRSCVFAFIVIAFLTGCKTTSVVQTEPPVVSQEISPELPGEMRGLIVTTNTDESPDADFLGNNTRLTIAKASEANFNVVFIPYGDIITSSDLKEDITNTESKNHNLIEFLVQESHKNDLKLYLTIDLFDLLRGKSGEDFSEFLADKEVSPELIETYKNFLSQEANAEKVTNTIFTAPIFPYLKSFLKENIKKIIEGYNVDGIGYDLTRWTQFYDISIEHTENDNSDGRQLDGKGNNIVGERLMDLMEDLVVESMLVKPYLVNSIIYPGNVRHEFFLKCLEDKIVDFIIPKFNTNMDNLIDEFSDLWDLGENDNHIAQGIFPCITIFNKDRDRPVLDDLIAFNKEMGSLGILFLADVPNDEKLSYFDIPYKFNDLLLLPRDLKKSSPFEVADLKLTPFTNDDPDFMIDLYGASRKKVMDANGIIGIVLAHPDSIDMNISGHKIMLNTNQWSVPYRYTIYPDSGAVREDPWIEFRRMPSTYTNNEKYHLLGKTTYPAAAWIGDDSVKVYKTGIFFNEIKFKEGSNRIRARVLTPDSLSVFYEQEFVYEKIDRTRPVFPLWIDPKSVEPSMDLELLLDDIVNISFHGSLGQKAYIELFPGGDMIKCARKDFIDYSYYLSEIPLTKLIIDKEYQFILHLETEEDSIQRKIYKFPLENKIIIHNLDQYPIVEIREENTRLTYNLGPIRLGGPIRSELGEGVMMKVNGKMGDNYRIRLDKIENSMVRQDQVEVLAKETVPPSYFISNISCGPGKGEDIVSIPYLEQVPYSINPEPDLNRIVITLYGVKTSSTWISHRMGRKIVDKITWQQTTPDTYKVFVNLKTSKIWGYDLQTDGRQLVLKIKHPRYYDLNNEKPLTGLKIAIEAGHGGESTGAVGLSGLLEKDINLDLALKFGEICKSMGAEVYQVRETDTTMGLLDKRTKVISSEADILISIHANAAGTSRGYLRVPGTSTYYNNPFWAPLAENVYDRLLELGLAEFGVVGSFNYTVIRVSQMPSILVEQAFMTHAEDEEKLADPDFRKQMANKIYIGLVDYLSYMEKAKD